MTGIPGAVPDSRKPGPSPSALAAVRAVTGLGSAPDPDAGTLRRALAARYGIETGAVRAGPGSAALLHAVIAGRAAAGGQVICSVPSWPPYADLAAAYGLKTCQVPLAGYRHDLPAITAAITPDTRLVILDSPHSVTGTTVGLGEARELAAALPPGAAVVYDNVYGEYQDNDIAPAIRDTVRSGEPVLVCRTFSKAHHLFALRAGYIMAPPQVMARSGPLTLRYDVSQPAQAAALASLADTGNLAANRHITRRGRHLASATLQAAGIPCAPGEGHGLLFAPPGPARAAAVLQTAGTAVREPPGHGVPGHLHLRTDNIPTSVLRDALTAMLETA